MPYLFHLDPLVLFLCFLPALINLFGIWHIWHRQFPSPQERLWWLLSCVFIPVLGGLIYFFIGMRRSTKL